MNDKYSRWYLGGIICLLVSGTIAAKSVFLVDNELESKTESKLEHWQLDRQSLRKYADRLKKITTEYIWPPASEQPDRSTRWQSLSARADASRWRSLTFGITEQESSARQADASPMFKIF